jgi:hypothetical protein
VREAPRDAVALYKRFNRYEPKKIGEFKDGFAIPKRVRLAGPAKWVTYESGKVDPATLKKPRRPLSYIHEIDPGVKLCLTDGKADTDVPPEFANAEALVLLGKSLGFSFEKNGEEIEAECTRCELYASPGDGRCLYVVEGKSKVLAMIWGGSLRVEGRGIVG